MGYYLQLDCGWLWHWYPAHKVPEDQRILPFHVLRLRVCTMPQYMLHSQQFHPLLGSDSLNNIPRHRPIITPPKTCIHHLNLLDRQLLLLQRLQLPHRRLPERAAPAQTDGGRLPHLVQLQQEILRLALPDLLLHRCERHLAAKDKQG